MELIRILWTIADFCARWFLVHLHYDFEQICTIDLALPTLWVHWHPVILVIRDILSLIIGAIKERLSMIVFSMLNRDFFYLMHYWLWPSWFYATLLQFISYWIGFSRTIVSLSVFVVRNDISIKLSTYETCGIFCGINLRYSEVEFNCGVTFREKWVKCKQIMIS
jgi:hypothetical protein